MEWMAEYIQMILVIPLLDEWELRSFMEIHGIDFMAPEDFLRSARLLVSRGRVARITKSLEEEGELYL